MGPRSVLDGRGEGLLGHATRCGAGLLHLVAVGPSSPAPEHVAPLCRRHVIRVFTVWHFLGDPTNRPLKDRSASARARFTIETRIGVCNGEPIGEDLPNVGAR